MLYILKNVAVLNWSGSCVEFGRERSLGFRDFGLMLSDLSDLSDLSNFRAECEGKTGGIDVFSSSELHPN